MRPFTPRALGFAAGFSALLFGGCSTQPTLPQATAPAPAVYKEAPALGDSAFAATLPSEWWRVFHDTELDALQKQAVAANRDLHQALARLDEARALARLSAAELRPHLAVQQGFTRGQASGNGEGGNGETTTYREHRSELQATYEFDLWGRHRHAANAAHADAKALAFDADALWLSLTAEVAQHYYQLRALDTERQLIEATIGLRRDTVRLQENRSQAGLISDADVTRARTELANVEAELQAVHRSRARLEHALAVLCGLPPSEFTVAVRPSLIAVPEAPSGLPSLLLRRRPDVLAADEQLRAASERVAVAHADFFPRISLTASAGQVSADLNTLAKSGSQTWSFGPSVYLPVFDGGANRAALAAARARYDQSLSAWRGVVLRAFREVEDSLSDLRTLGDQGEAVDRALTSAQDTAKLAVARYDKGLSNYLDVVDAQRGALQAERLSVQLRGQRTSAMIALATALGGGWTEEASVAQR